MAQSWARIAMGCLPWPLVAFFGKESLTVAICHQSVPDCLNLSPSVPNCPLLSHLHFSSEEQRYREFFLTFSCFEVP
jgi:hypothetical protein